MWESWPRLLSVGRWHRWGEILFPFLVSHHLRQAGKLARCHESGRIGHGLVATFRIVVPAPRLGGRVELRLVVGGRVELGLVVGVAGKPVLKAWHLISTVDFQATQGN